MFLEAKYYGIKYVMFMKHASDITNKNCFGKFCMCEAEQVLVEESSVKHLLFSL